MSHCGRTKNLLITLIDNDTILAAIFDRQITLSSVSSSIARHVEALRKALLTIKNNMETMFGPDPMSSMPSFSNDDVDQGFNSFLNGTSSHAPQHQDAHAAVATQAVQQHHVAAPTPEPQQRQTAKAPEYVQVSSHQNTSPIQQEHHHAPSGVAKYKPAPQMPNHSPKTEHSSQQHKVPAPGNTEQFSVSAKNYKKPAEQAESQQANKGLFSRMFNKGK